MFHNGQRVTFTNYRQVYPHVGEDIQEEIYAALGQDLDIDKYLQQALELGYDGASWLCQVRRALVDGLDSQFLRLTSDRVLVRLRYAHNHGIALDNLKRFISEGFSEKKWEILLGWVLNGIGGSHQENMWGILGGVSDDCLNIIDSGFRSGLPVWEIYSLGNKVSYDRVSVCLGLMRNNRWSPRYISENWQTEVLQVLLNVNRVVYSTLISVGLSADNSLAMLKEVVECAKQGIPDDSLVRLLGISSATGREYYEPWLAERVRLAYMKNYPIEDYFVGGLSKDDADKLDRGNEYNRSTTGSVGGALFPKRA